MRLSLTRQRPPDSRTLVRVQAWIHHRKLDLRIGAGENPDLDPLLRSRALGLIEPGSRRRLVASLEELAAPEPRAAEFRDPGGASVLEFGSRAQFDALVERLKAPTPVRPQGVAQVLLMITGGTGPLWGVGGEVELARAAGRALVALERGPAVSAADG